MLENIKDYFDILRPALIEGGQIFVLAIVFYLILRLLRNTAGIFVFASFIAIIGILGFFSWWVRMPVLALLSKSIITQLPLVAIVIFQQDLRRMLTLLSNRRSLKAISKSRLDYKEKRADMLRQLVQDITQAVCALTTLPEWRGFLKEGLSQTERSRLSTKNTGALIAIEGRQGLDEYTEKGVKLDCAFEQHLIRTIFYEGAPLHDGGIVLRGNRIVAASCQFPPAPNELFEAAHTRHNAAVGLARQSDAMVIVVSEETGWVSVATGENIERINQPRGLEKLLEERFGLDQARGNGQETAGREGFLKRLGSIFVPRRDPMDEDEEEPQSSRRQ